MSSMGFLVQGAKVGSDRGDRYAQLLKQSIKAIKGFRIHCRGFG